MTPEERAARILQDYRHAAVRPIASPLFLGRAIADAIRIAVNDTIEEIATKLERNLHTSAAAIVRQMKEPNNDP